MLKNFAKLYSFIAVIIIFLLIFIALLYKNREHSEKLVIKHTVSTSLIKSIDYYDQIEALGLVKSVKGAFLEANSAGRVTEVNVISGQKVKKGDLLLKINPDETIAKIKYDKAKLNLDKINFERQQKLYKAKATSAADLDIVKATYQQSKATLMMDEADLNDKIMKAPFDGTVGIVDVKVGQYLTIGDKLFPVQILSPIFIDFAVPSKLQESIKVNQDVVANLDAYPLTDFHGKVIAINNLINISTNGLEVRSKFKNNAKKIIPGDLVNITVNISDKQSIIAISSQSVVYNDGQIYVFILGKENKVHKQIITLGKQLNKDKIIVTSGLKVGQTIISAGANKLKDGDLVKINNKVK